MEEVFERLRQARLKLMSTKCELLRKKVKYLGRVVSSNEVAKDPDKIQAIKEWKEPSHMRELQACLGTAGSYRQYLPFTSLVGKDREWQWGPTLQHIERRTRISFSVGLSRSSMLLLFQHRCKCRRGGRRAVSDPSRTIESHCLL